jgi:hypothetical protein
MSDTLEEMVRECYYEVKSLAVQAWENNLMRISYLEFARELRKRWEAEQPQKIKGWTDRPTEEGEYWYCGDRSNLGDVSKYRVRDEPIVLTKGGDGHLRDDSGISVSSYEGIWYGPLTPPEPEMPVCPNCAGKMDVSRGTMGWLQAYCKECFWHTESFHSEQEAIEAARKAGE